MATARILDRKVAEVQTAGAVTNDLLVITVATNSHVSIKGRIKVFDAAGIGGTLDVDAAFTRSLDAPNKDGAAHVGRLHDLLASLAPNFVIIGNDVVLQVKGI